MGTTRQRRIALAITLVTVALTALFLAQGSTRLIAGWVLATDGDDGASGQRAGPAVRPTPRTPKEATAILQRNIFDSETGDLTRVAAAAPAETANAPEPQDPDAPPPPCDGSTRLVGALVNERRPELSFAAISGASGTAMLFRPGMSIDGRELVGVQPSRVYLRPTGGNLCELAMFSSEPGAPPPRPANAPSDDERPERVIPTPGGGEGAISQAEMESGINRGSETEYTVARSLVDKLLENQAEIMRTARIIPHEEGGRVVGVKLYGIRRNSLLGRLGIQNGDMLRTINGYDMTSPDSALEAYSRLRSQNHLTISVVRRSQAMTLDYNIQ